MDRHLIAFPTPSGAPIPSNQAAPANAQAADPQEGVSTHVIRGVVVLQVAGRLSHVVQDLNWAIQLALAEEPRGVVCDFSEGFEAAEPGAVEALAAAGRHASDWSGIPVAVVCTVPQARAASAADSMPGDLIVTTSVFCALSAILATPTAVRESLRLASHPTAIFASSEFVTRTLLDWGLAARLSRPANLVVNDLVTSSTRLATTEIELSIAWNRTALRLAVRDNSPEVPRLPYTHLDLLETTPPITADHDLSRTFGVLPTADGGKVVWAVLQTTEAHLPIKCSPPRLT